MSLIISDIAREIRENDVANSTGFICDKCNVSAYYFNTRNSDLHAEKTCLICSKKDTKGIILEDFIFTLSKNIRNHYNYTEDVHSDAIPLGEIIRRFTYNNEQAVEKLAHLLCKSNPDFFKEKGRYKDILDETLIKNYTKKAVDDWHELSNEVKHNRRFTNTKATQFYESLISACILNVEKDNTELNSASTKIDKGTSLFRGRIVHDKNHMNIIKSNFKKELGAPPENLAASNRMSPSGISFMYTSGDYETAISELRPYVNDVIAIGEFVSTQDLNFFDFTLLNNVKLKKANILENPRAQKTFQNRYLLSELHEIISKAVRPSDLNYIDIQIFAETIRNYRNGLFDGIIFKSSQRPGGLNYVLFGKYDEAKKAKDYYMSLDGDCRVKFYKVNKVTTATEEIECGTIM